MPSPTIATTARRTPSGEAGGEQRDSQRTDQEARGDDRLRAKPVCHPRASERAENRTAVEYQQERQRAFGVEPGAQHELGQPSVERVDQQQAGRAHQTQHDGGEQVVQPEQTREPGLALGHGHDRTGGRGLGLGDLDAGACRDRASLLEPAARSQPRHGFGHLEVGQREQRDDRQRTDPEHAAPADVLQ